MTIHPTDGAAGRSLMSHKGEALIPAAAETGTQYFLEVNLHEAISNAAEEMADILSTFGRFSKVGRKNDQSEEDFSSSILEEQVNEKLDELVRQVTKLSHSTSFLAFARSLFPNESDLLLALRVIAENRQLSSAQKKIIETAVADVEKFGDCKKIQSGINVAQIAKRFGERDEESRLTAKALRDSYLLFLELVIPAGLIYQHWIEDYGCQQRTRLLAFTMSALITDIKANEPGIHYAEFGPLSTKLCDARLLHTLDQRLVEECINFPVDSWLHHGHPGQEEEVLIKLYLTGLNDTGNFPQHLQDYIQHSLARLPITQQATVIQSIRNLYTLTPAFFFTTALDQEIVLDEISSRLSSSQNKSLENPITSTVSVLG